VIKLLRVRAFSELGGDRVSAVQLEFGFLQKKCSFDGNIRDLQNKAITTVVVLRIDLFRAQDVLTVLKK